MKILHLSDIHFGRNNPSYKETGKFEKKDDILQGLISSIKDNGKPDHIVVTGDIAWHGEKKEFDEAKAWFNKLLKELSLTADNISFCPGNHDAKWSYGSNISNVDEQSSINVLDNIYRYENIHYYQSALENYEMFCSELGVIPFKFPLKNRYEASYMVGYKDVNINNKQIRIVAFNTALLSHISNKMDDKCVIGLPQVNELIYRKIIEKNNDRYTIAIFHHADRFLKADELNEYNNRAATLVKLRNNVDLVLCGHTETEGKPFLMRQEEGAFTLIAGAAYYEDSYQNAYSFIDVEKNTMPTLTSFFCKDGIWERYFEQSEIKEKDEIYEKTELGNFKGNGSLIITSEIGKYKVPIKRLDLYDDGYVSNDLDPSRLITITGIPQEKKQKNGKYQSKFEAQENSQKSESVRARLATLSFWKAIEQNSSRENICEILTDEGEIIYHGENIKGKIDVDNKEEWIEYCQKLKSIEDFFDVRFVCPNEIKQEEDIAIRKLSEYIITNGMELLPISKFSLLICNKVALQNCFWLFLKKRKIYIEEKADVVCNLFGKKIEMKDIILISGPYKVNLFQLFNKIMTFEKGDQRILEFKEKNEIRTYIGNSDFMRSDNVRDMEPRVKMERKNAIIADWGLIKIEKEKQNAKTDISK